jgi:hypothetical protein
MVEMNTLSEVMQRLQERHIPEFRFNGTAFISGEQKQYRSKDLSIIKVYRFEGDSDPSDMSIVYLFETNDGAHGYTLNAYGVYDDWGEAYDNFLREVPEKGHQEQVLFTL